MTEQRFWYEMEGLMQSAQAQFDVHFQAFAAYAQVLLIPAIVLAGLALLSMVWMTQ